MARKKKQLTEAPSTEVFNLNDALAEWYSLTEKMANEIAPIIARELELRKQIVENAFCGVEEGTHYVDLADGWRLKGELRVNRVLDEASLPVVMQQLPPGSQDWLIDWKPRLKLPNYRDMPPDYKRIMDQCVIAKPGAPGLEIVPPKAPE